ncbi:hypothetical protein QYF36_006552 [Acer negundo]|nr:hypothetical protein QYF36_006552 [Acer negundo]
MASHFILEDVCQDLLDKEVDPNYQECLSDNPTYIDLLAKGEKNALAKKVREVEEIILKRDRIISSLSLGGSSDSVVKDKLTEASLPSSEKIFIIDKKAPKIRRSKTKNKLKNKVHLETLICASLTPEGKIVRIMLNSKSVML